jgi:hypothetical protein
MIFLENQLTERCSSGGVCHVKSGEAKGGIYVIISKYNYGMSHFTIVIGPVRVWHTTTLLSPFPAQSLSRPRHFGRLPA